MNFFHPILLLDSGRLVQVKSHCVEMSVAEFESFADGLANMSAIIETL